MSVIGLSIGYANYDVETTTLGAAGLSFTHYETLDAISDHASVQSIMVRQHAMDAEVMGLFPNLKQIQRYGVGVDNVDLDTAKQRGITVCNTPDYGQEHEVSDHAVALYFAQARNIVRRDGDVRNGAWGIDQAEPIFGHRGATLGLIGFGRIAQAAWRKFNALGFAKCLVSDPAVTPELAKEKGVETASIADICAASDVISLHCPLLPATKHIINGDMLGRMKKTAYLINVSRGGLIDEDALATALTNGQIAGAGLDVFEQEPPNRSAPLFAAPNTVFTDHLAWYSEASVIALQQAAADEVVRSLTGTGPQNAVT